MTVAWQGGEPTLMGVNFYRKAIEIQEKYRLLGNIREKHLRELVGSAQQYKFGQAKCAGYKGFFRRVTEPLKIMAMLLSCGRPASDVMPSWPRTRRCYRKHIKLPDQNNLVRAAVA